MPAARTRRTLQLQSQLQYLQLHRRPTRLIFPREPRRLLRQLLSPQPSQPRPSLLQLQLLLRPLRSTIPRQPPQLDPLLVALLLPPVQLHWQAHALALALLLPRLQRE